MRRLLPRSSLLALAAPAAAENVRIEVGLAGVYPAGEWTTCRVSGLDNVPDGTLIDVTVNEMFTRELRVQGGVAEGLFLIPDEAPAIDLDLPRGRVSVPRGQLETLRCVKDRLPVIVIGDNAPDPAWLSTVLGAPDVFPVRMSSGEFFRHKPVDYAWVHAFVIGTLSADEIERLREYLPADGAVIVVFPQDRRGWLTQLPFETTTCFETCHKGLAPYLPVPRGSFRSELYGMFGPPKWPREARRDVALCALGVMVLFSLWAVFPRGGRARRGVSLGGVIIGCAIMIWLASERAVPAPETVAVFEHADGEALGVETTFTSLAHLRRGEGESPITPAPPEGVPVASLAGRWVESPLFMDAQGVLTRVPEVPSRDVVVARRVYAPKAMPDLVGRPHADARVREIREATERWLLSTRHGSAYTVVWLDAPAGGRGVNAGILVATKRQFASGDEGQPHP